jgi:Tol biopolymer transport system component
MRDLFVLSLFPAVIPGSLSSASHDLTKLTGPYLGQKPPGMTAALFAPGVVSTGYFEHSSPTFSPDGREVFWGVQESDSFSNPRPIIFMERIDGAWTKPRMAPFVKKQYCYDNPFFSVDGRRLYFGASLADEKDGVRTCDLWYVERTATGWSEQRKLPSPPNSNDLDAQPAVAANGSIYFISRFDKSPDGFGLYYSRFVDGAYQPPVAMDERFNILDADWTPYIAPDESYFVFCSFRKGGFGSGDLYISFKRPDGSWGDVINMGPRINTEGNERFPIVTPDGKYLFFNSTRKIAGAGQNEPGNGDGDVYWIDATIIEKLRPKPPR